MLIGIDTNNVKWFGVIIDTKPFALANGVMKDAFMLAEYGTVDMDNVAFI